MTTSKMLDCLTLSTLQQVSLERLHYAVGGLADGSITVHLTRHSESELRALVTNGDGKDYGVTITETLTTCSCRDSLYRGVVCKHAVATALQVLRTAPELKEQPGARPAALPDPIHLMGREGIILCGQEQSTRFWVYPWTENVWNWPDICPECKATYRQPKAARAA